MRKFKKDVSFMMSDAMRREGRTASSARRRPARRRPAELNDADGLGIAFICSFSIQIIFIVAFILLLIFVFILNIVFWWIAFFKICLPDPEEAAAGVDGRRQT